MKDLKSGIFESYAAYCFTVEYQKHRLPHVYIALFLHNHRFTTSESIDEVVCAELSDPV
jgi:hypothetical protein